jgi:kynurenine formamidase
VNCLTHIDGVKVEWNTTVVFDISLPITNEPTVNAFGLPPARLEPFRAGTFVGSIEEGGPVWCDVVTLAPHGDGTHTECIGHVAGRGYRLLDSLRNTIVSAELITVDLLTLDNGDRVIARESLERAWPRRRTEALIIRTRPNSDAKRTAIHSGANPAYIHLDSMRVIDERNVLHLLVDLPSVDPEEDEGALAAHKLFWGWPATPRPDRTITELIYVPDDIADGLYILEFGAAAFDGDAAPSRPRVYPILSGQ